MDEGPASGKRPHVLILGATGLIGGHVLPIVASSSAFRVSALSRRMIDLPADSPVQNSVAASSDWPIEVGRLAPDVLVSCIGTTIRQVGGNADAFRAVDQHLVLACATAARRSGTTQMIVVTSVGASSRASSLYLNAKGMVEDGLDALAFPRLDILRPGLLLGERDELRAAEGLGQRLAPLFIPLLFGPMRKYRAVPAQAVARAICALMGRTGQGRFNHEHDAIQSLAG